MEREIPVAGGAERQFSGPNCSQRGDYVAQLVKLGRRDEAQKHFDRFKMLPLEVVRNQMRSGGFGIRLRECFSQPSN